MTADSEIRFPDRMYDAVAEWLQVKYSDARMPDYYWPADAASLLILVRGMLNEHRECESAFAVSIRGNLYAWAFIYSRKVVDHPSEIVTWETRPVRSPAT